MEQLEGVLEMNPCKNSKVKVTDEKLKEIKVQGRKLGERFQSFKASAKGGSRGVRNMGK